jgi:hydrogenase assembly chaperone HypC/HupF
MCRTIPRRVLRVEGERAEVDVEGRPTWVDARAVTGLRPGEYVAVYAGVALERLPAEVAAELLEFEAELERMLEEAVILNTPGEAQ